MAGPRLSPKVTGGKAPTFKGAALARPYKFKYAKFSNKIKPPTVIKQKAIR